LFSSGREHDRGGGDRWSGEGHRHPPIDLPPGRPVEAGGLVLEGKPFKATPEYISPKGATDQGTIKFTIRAAVKLDQELFLRSNYSANSDIVLDKREDALAVNEGDLIIEGKSTSVEVETAPQKFEKREIKTGLSDGINIEVISGLKADEKIKHRYRDFSSSARRRILSRRYCSSCSNARTSPGGFPTQRISPVTFGI
jgi:multidrug efflux pump subunit AcrA (membrane-fusion protein)